MKIAVASQDKFRSVTAHAGRARRFILYHAAAGAAPREIDRLELPKAMSFHEFGGEGAHPLDGVDVLIVGGAGERFLHRLAARGIEVKVTSETDPVRAVRLYLDGTLPPGAVHGEDHDHVE